MENFKNVDDKILLKVYLNQWNLLILFSKKITKLFKNLDLHYVKGTKKKSLATTILFIFRDICFSAIKDRLTVIILN